MNKKLQGCIVAFSSFAFLLSLAFGLYGCSAATGGCSASVNPSLEVFVTDAATGQPVAETATVTAIDGSFTETLPASIGTINPDGSQTLTGFSGPLERVGIYTVRVTRPGYADAEKTSVRVTKGPCHVRTQTVAIALTPITKSQVAQ